MMDRKCMVLGILWRRCTAAHTFFIIELVETNFYWIYVGCFVKISF